MHLRGDLGNGALLPLSEMLRQWLQALCQCNHCLVAGGSRVCEAFPLV